MQTGKQLNIFNDIIFLNSQKVIFLYIYLPFLINKYFIILKLITTQKWIIFTILHEIAIQDLSILPF